MKIILGSESKKRIELLAGAGIVPDAIMPASVDEKALRADSPEALTLLLARTKRDALLPGISEPALLITADTVLYRGNDLFEKPESEEQEWEFLRAHDGVTPFGFVSSVTVTNTATGESLEATEVGEIVSGPFSDDYIRAYIQKGTYTQYAAGFTYMDTEFHPHIKFLSGSSDCLIGLPVEKTKELLKALGWQEK